MDLNAAQRRFRDEWPGAIVVAATPRQAEEELAARYLGFRLESVSVEE